MIQEAVQINGEGRIRQTFDNVAGFQYVPAVPVGREPKGSQIVHVVADDERIVVGLGDFVAKRGDIHKSRAEKLGADPTRIVQHPSLFRVGGRVEDVRVVAQNAALRDVAEKQIYVRVQERGDIFRSDGIVRDVGHYDPEKAGVENEIGWVVVYQNEKTTRSVPV